MEKKNYTLIIVCCLVVVVGMSLLGMVFYPFMTWLLDFSFVGEMAMVISGIFSALAIVMTFLLTKDKKIRIIIITSCVIFFGSSYGIQNARFNGYCDSSGDYMIVVGGYMGKKLYNKFGFIIVSDFNQHYQVGHSLNGTRVIVGYGKPIGQPDGTLSFRYYDTSGNRIGGRDLTIEHEGYAPDSEIFEEAKEIIRELDGIYM